MIQYMASGQRLLPMDKWMPVSGTTGAYTLKILFSEEWESMTEKHAVFHSDAATKSALIGSDGSCTVPWEPLQQPGYLDIGIYGVKEGVRYPTVWARRLEIFAGAPEGNAGQAPTETLWEQYVAQVAQSAKKAEAAQAAAETARSAAETAQGAAEEAENSAKTDASEAASAKSQVQTYASSAKSSASSASSAASSASSAANRAAMAENSASGHASQAGSYASQAGSSAQQAGRYASNASASAIKAEAAQTAAETAAGKAGKSWRPTVSAEGTLSWALESNDASAPVSVNITGPQGPKGENGDPGTCAVTSVNSKTGAVVLSASDVGAQPTITANGFLKGDGFGNITAGKPVFTVNITQATKDGPGTADKTAAEIIAAYEAGYAVQAACKYYSNTSPVILSLLATDAYDAGLIVFSGIFSLSDESEGDMCEGLTVMMQGTTCAFSRVKVPSYDVYDRIFKLKQVYLVTFTKNTASEYTANKTLREIFEAARDGYYVYGYIDIAGTDAYVPMSSFFTTGQGTTDSPTKYFAYFEGPMASANMGNLVNNNQCASFISLAATNNADATSTTYTYTTYQLLSTAATVNNKSFATRNITLDASDVGALPVTGGTMTGYIIFGDSMGARYGLVGVRNNNLLIGRSNRSGIAFLDDRTHFLGTVDFSGAKIQGLPGLLPTITTSDNGKFLRVVNGAWAAATVENANGVSF